MTVHAAILRAIGLWALACALTALLGTPTALAHGAHHHEPAAAAQPVERAASSRDAVTVSVASAIVSACDPAHERPDHSACCAGPSCCTAGGSAAVVLADAPALAQTRPAATRAGAGREPPGRETRPAEPPPRPTI